MKTCAVFVLLSATVLKILSLDFVLSYDYFCHCFVSSVTFHSSHHFLTLHHSFCIRLKVYLDLYCVRKQQCKHIQCIRLSHYNPKVSRRCHKTWNVYLQCVFCYFWSMTITIYFMINATVLLNIPR